MTRWIFLCIIVVLVGACTDGNKVSEKGKGSEIAKLAALVNGDSISYVGKTRYRKMPSNFDNTYFDTVKIFRLNEEFFAFEIKELKYQWLVPLPGETLPELSVSWIRDSIKIDNNGKFTSEIADGDFRSKLSLEFIGEDSLLLNDIEEDTRDKILEIHEFIGAESFIQK